MISCGATALLEGSSVFVGRRAARVLVGDDRALARRAYDESYGCIASECALQEVFREKPSFVILGIDSAERRETNGAACFAADVQDAAATHDGTRERYIAVNTHCC